MIEDHSLSCPTLGWTWGNFPCLPPADARPTSSCLTWLFCAWLRVAFKRESVRGGDIYQPFVIIACYLQGAGCLDANECNRLAFDRGRLYSPTIKIHFIFKWALWWWWWSGWRSSSNVCGVYLGHYINRYAVKYLFIDLQSLVNVLCLEGHFSRVGFVYVCVCGCVLPCVCLQTWMVQNNEKSL